MYTSRSIRDTIAAFEYHVPEEGPQEYASFREDRPEVNRGLAEFRDEWEERGLGESEDVLSGWEWGFAHHTVFDLWTADEAEHALKVVQKMLALSGRTE